MTVREVLVGMGKNDKVMINQRATRYTDKVVFPLGVVADVGSDILDLVVWYTEVKHDAFLGDIRYVCCEKTA